MIHLSDNNKKYFDELWGKIDKKMKKVASRSFDKIPYTAELGVHDDKSIRDLDWWTNGFWGAMMWILYLQTKDEQYKNTAINAENKLRKVLHENAIRLHHDVGFMWNITSGVHYRIDGDKAAMNDELLSAFSLASRFNIKGGYIRAWNPEQSEEENSGWAIIDCMMNVPLLYRASKIAGDDRFIHIAKAHAYKTMENHIRPDGSVKHIVEYNPETGDFAFIVQLSEFGDNTVRFRATKEGKQDAVINMNVYYKPTLAKYSSLAWKMDYDGLRRLYEQWNGQVFLCVGPIVDTIREEDKTYFVMDVGTEGTQELLILENKSSTTSPRLGTSYTSYAHVTGRMMYNAQYYPLLTALYVDLTPAE